MFLTLQDCLDMIDLTEDEVAAVAEHEHVPMIVGAEFANYLLEEPEGVPRLRAIIVDDIRAAERCGNVAHARKLRAVLRHFVLTHPCYEGTASVKRMRPA